MTPLMISLALIAPTSGSVQVTKVGVVDAIRAIAFAAAPTGSQFLVSSEDGTVRVMDARMMKTVCAMTKHVQPAYGLAWSPNGQLVATGDETARIFIETPTGRKTREYRTHTRGIQKISFSTDNAHIISTGKDDVIKMYDLSSPKPKDVHELLGQGANFYSATYSPKGGLFVSGVLAEGARVYDANTRQLRLDLKGHSGEGVLDCCFNPNGSCIASAGKDATAIIWDTKSGKKIGTIRGHEDWVTSVAYSPNGALLATSSTDGTVRLWNAASLQPVAVIKEQFQVGSPLCFAADGSMLMTVNAAGAIQFNKLNPPQAPVAKAKPKARRLIHIAR